MRIPVKPIDSYPWYLRAFFRHQRRKFGAVLNPAALWARSPKLFLTFTLLYGALDRKGSPIDPVLRSLVMVRISQLNWCPFCVDINSAALLERGMAREKLENLSNWRDCALFDDKEHAALDYAEAITLSDRRVDDELMNRLKKFHDDDSIVELTALIGFQNMSSLFNAALDVPAQGFCALA